MNDNVTPQVLTETNVQQVVVVVEEEEEEAQELQQDQQPLQPQEDFIVSLPDTILPSIVHDIVVDNISMVDVELPTPEASLNDLNASFGELVQSL